MGADTDKYFYPGKEERIEIGRREQLKADENLEGLILNPQAPCLVSGEHRGRVTSQWAVLPLSFHWWQSTVQLSREGSVCACGLQHTVGISVFLGLHHSASLTALCHSGACPLTMLDCVRCSGHLPQGV